MIHKHKWIYVKDTNDYLTLYGATINYGRQYKCSKCNEIFNMGSSIVYLVNLTPWSKTYDQYLPKWSWSWH